MNEGLTGLERVINDRIFIFLWTIPLTYGSTTILSSTFFNIDDKLF